MRKFTIGFILGGFAMWEIWLNAIPISNYLQRLTAKIEQEKNNG